MIIITPLMLKRVFTSRIFLVIETFYLLAFPLILLRFKPDWIRLRLSVLIASLIYVCSIIYTQRITAKQLGLKPDDWCGSLKTILPPTVFSLLLTFVVFKWFHDQFTIPLLIEEVKTPSVFLSVLIHILVSAPLQEFIYRGYLISRLELVSPKPIFLKLYTAIFFMLIHTPFHNWLLTLSCLILGWWWAGHFLKFRNIFALMLSHALIGSIYLILISLG